MRHGIIVFFCILLFWPNTGNASLERFTCTGQSAISEPEARTHMSKIQAWYDTHASLEARFTQYSFSAAMDISETSGGAVWFTNSGMMRWKYEEPEPQDFLIRQNTLWFYRPTDSLLVIDQLRKMLVSNLPVAFMMGLGDLSRDFSFVSGCRVQDETRLILRPVSKTESDSEGPVTDNTSINQFILLTGKDGQPLGAQIADISGNLTAIEFDNLSVNQTDTTRIFKPDFPKGIDILDRRLDN